MFGCAHPITMNPDLEAIKTPASGRIDKKVGYHLPDSLRALEVTTPGGGGDKVRYFPYRDIEPGFYKALSETFTTVTKVQNAKDWPAVQSGGTSILITPQISTTSSSESAFTWPPTLFTVTLDCAITKGDGTAVQNVKVVGEGQASFDEFKANFSLSAVRATNDALAKLIKALSEMTDL
jgi:hypothetical protein